MVQVVFVVSSFSWSLAVGICGVSSFEYRVILIFFEYSSVRLAGFRVI